VIFITPRSGSTWLGDLLTKQGTVGFPEEYLNADCLPATNVELHANKELDYLNGLLATRSATNGIFSIKTCWGEVERFSSVDFFRYFEEAQFVHLRRRDILSQAISLLTATESGVFHVRDGVLLGAEHRTPRNDFNPTSMDEASALTKIRKWVGHIVNFESATELQFAVRGIEPTRIYYEDMVDDVESVIRKVLSLMQVEPTLIPTESGFSRTSSPQTLNIKSKFVNQNREFLFKATSIRPALSY